MTIITRVGFCPKCFKEARPKTGQEFIVFGATSQAFIGERALRNGKRGFTPHIYEFERLIGKTVYYLKTCCMCGCGACIVKDEERKLIYLDEEKTEEFYIPLNDWNALVQYKDETFKI